LSENKPEEAKDVLKKGLDLSPQSAEMYFEISKAYALSQNAPKAFWALKRVVALDPDSAIAAEAQALLDKANQ
jgi:predicted TPR repeat methyltransferase